MKLIKKLAALFLSAEIILSTTGCGLLTDNSSASEEIVQAESYSASMLEGASSDETLDLPESTDDISSKSLSEQPFSSPHTMGEATSSPQTTSQTDTAQSAACFSEPVDIQTPTKPLALSEIDFSENDIPEYGGKAYTAVNGNMPFFDTTDIPAISFETYSPLDNLGRCGTAYACIGTDIMPTESRSDISGVEPSGWHSIKINGDYLYNRCHLIGYQLTGENANAENLITGTRYMNVSGMLPFENMVADYIKEENNHVLYRVTPIYRGPNLVAAGVLMEGYSVEDNGEGICFNVFCHNVQEDVEIDYATGDAKSTIPEQAASSTSSSSTTTSTPSSQQQVGTTYILNYNLGKMSPASKAAGDNSVQWGDTIPH